MNVLDISPVTKPVWRQLIILLPGILLLYITYQGFFFLIINTIKSLYTCSIKETINTTFPPLITGYTLKIWILDEFYQALSVEVSATGRYHCSSFHQEKDSILVLLTLYLVFRGHLLIRFLTWISVKVGIPVCLLRSLIFK